LSASTGPCDAVATAAAETARNVRREQQAMRGIAFEVTSYGFYTDATEVRSARSSRDARKLAIAPRISTHCEGAAAGLFRQPFYRLASCYFLLPSEVI
jgi:hypothetical protein